MGDVPYSSNTEKHCSKTGYELCNSDFFSGIATPVQMDSFQNMKPETPCHCETRDPSHCLHSTFAVTLGVKSYATIALAFVPNPHKVSIHLKFKTRSHHGLLVKLQSRKEPVSLSLYVSRYNYYRYLYDIREIHE